MGPTSPQNQNFDNQYSNSPLDPSIAKQMAALNAAGIVIMANGRPLPGVGTSSFVNQIMGQDSASTPVTGIQNFPQQHANTSVQPNIPSSADVPLTAQPYPVPRSPPQNVQSSTQRRRNFLSSLANVMNNCKMPLPQALTGIPSNYDPANSPLKMIEPTPGELGSFRLAGKDVDMFKLWGIVFRTGGGHKVC